MNLPSQDTVNLASSPSSQFAFASYGEAKQTTENSLDTPVKCLSGDKYYSFLEKVRDEIEKMDKIHHVRILKILKEYKNIKLNENKSGIFINLSFLPNEAIETIVKYIEYIKEQEKYILTVENQQESFKTLLSSNN